jgi:hypothetical protein
VVQKEIAKISAVPISRHVTAFAIILRIGILSPLRALARALILAGPASAHLGLDHDGASEFGRSLLNSARSVGMRRLPGLLVQRI